MDIQKVKVDGVLPEDMEIVITGDGSPSLAFKRFDGYVEKMHHAAGALSESLFIYHEALQIVVRNSLVPRVLSVGLGLGYNEMITLAEIGARPGKLDYKIYSFEALPFLKDSLCQWSTGETGPLNFVYDQILSQICERIEAKDFSTEAVAGALRSHALELRGAFPVDASSVSGCNLVYYDAYSNKMDAGLWMEDMLVEKLGSCLAPDCVFATYAATGALNRALKRLGFHLEKKAGFQGKRQSTLALRGSIVG